MARKIVVFSTKTNVSKSVISDATTWGQLRGEIGSMLNEEMVATILETKNQLVSFEAILPEGEFKLVLTPAKTKSGAEIIDTASVLQSLKEKWNQAFTDVMNEIEDGDHSTDIEIDSSSSATLSASDKAAIEKLKRELGN